MDFDAEEKGHLLEHANPVQRPTGRCRVIWRAAFIISLCSVAVVAWNVLETSKHELAQAQMKALSELNSARPEVARKLEEERRQAAITGERPLLTREDVKNCEEGDGQQILHGKFCPQVEQLFAEVAPKWNRWQHWDLIWERLKENPKELRWEALSYVIQLAFGFTFPYLNFVQGFPRPDWWWQFLHFWRWIFRIPDPKWKPPVKGEKIGLVSYEDYALNNFGQSLGADFFNNYYTGERVPSWEDNTRHKIAVNLLDGAVKAGRAAGIEPMDKFRPLEPRFALDNDALISAGWAGFRHLKPYDIKYASNGVWGVSLIESLVEQYGSKGKEVLGPLMSDSVFSVHLHFDGELFYVDMSALEKYRPIEGYAPLGGKATFKEDGGSLHMVRLEYNGSVFTNFENETVTTDYQLKSKRTGWRFAEGALIASLLSMTNLVLHVKDLHLELAAVFQAVTVDAFAEHPDHTMRKLLDPFIHRSVQATNDNFKLLFEHHAAEFSLAPLPVDEQLRLIGDFIRDDPLNLAHLDMESFGGIRNMTPAFSTAEAVADSSRWGWRWHHRALSTQRLYDKFIECRLNQFTDETLGHDVAVQAWWKAMVKHMPAFNRATVKNPEWASADVVTMASLRRVLKVLLVWLSWIHEDVGHSAASYVYNPVYTPMNVPVDGVGVPMRSYIFNVAAYRGFVFLERAALLDEPPSFWFDSEECHGVWWWRTCSTPPTDPGLKCFTDLQNSMKALGDHDVAFKECDKTGFYSCVDRVETAVSS